MSIVRVAIVVLLAVAAARPVDAAPIFYSSVFAAATHIGGQYPNDVENVLVYSTDTLGPYTASLPGGSATASVMGGVLRAFATGDGSGVATNANASFFDTLTLQSATLPAGTQVQLQAKLLFTRHVTPNGVPAGNPCSMAAVAYAGMDASTGGQLFEQDTTCDSNDINNSVGFFTGFIGQELTINAYLNAAVSALSPATADASNTLRFLLTPVGDFTYTTASGNNYVETAVVAPEPSTVLLVSSALWLSGVRARRRLREILPARSRHAA